jgi:hypothetical protein
LFWKSDSINDCFIRNIVNIENKVKKIRNGGVPGYESKEGKESEKPLTRAQVLLLKDDHQVIQQNTSPYDG